MQDMGIISPSFEQFQTLAKTRRVIPVYTKILADSLTPIGLYRALVLRDGTAQAGTFLLESAAENAQWSRYSFIGAHSRATLTTSAGKVFWQGETPVGAPTDGDPVEAIQKTLKTLHTERFDHLPPLTSGLVGYLGWDVVRHWENLPHQPQDDIQLPEFALNLVSDMAIHDNTDGTVTLIANAINFNGTDDNVEQAYEDAVERVHCMLDKLSQPLERSTVSELHGTNNVEHALAQAQCSMTEKEFLNVVEQSRQNIIDGDVFQLVLSRRFTIENHAEPLDVYRMLRQSNPSAYMYLFNFEDTEGQPFHIVGSSPEALVTLKDGVVSTHPIAGSRPRGATREEDLKLSEELLADDKERSEHLMLVDLARNDLSRIAVPGSVAVEQFMEIERFSHIMHISSTVTAQKGEDYDAYDVLRATFPAGTLSGAPKPRAMQLIDQYEPQSRGMYGGVCGYFDFAGNMDMAIAIRTALLKGTHAYIQAGAGLVLDSDPSSEEQETCHKAAAPLRAVALAAGIKRLSTGTQQHPTELEN
ncbi:anthranilate synthase component I [Rothia sp. P7181]|uniref:anthranilate synthase component I n=1 Tax=Rothia sp. P7181 TaxID=3402663 RepID=UPI003ADDD2FE